VATDAVSTAYSFDNATSDAALQVRLLAEILDRHTSDVLARSGVRPGWRCLDLGAGGGSITHWLAERVGPGGGVVAMDADPRHIPAHDRIELRTADISTAELGEAEYDLIHARLLLMHLPDRLEVVRRAAAALKPGGLLVVSDWECSHTDEMLLRGSNELADAFLAFQRGLCQLMTSRGASLDWARLTPLALHEAGLVDVETELYNRVWSGGEAGCLLHACNSRQLEAPLRATGMTTGQLAVLREGLADPRTLAYQYPMFTTVGRRPAG
jgi:trans-aconitate methyltransferase